MGVQVTFNYATWAQLFPQLAASVGALMASEYFNVATTFHRNDGGGPVADATMQLTMLNFATAHIATLMAPQANGQPRDPTIVGRISQASEGSVSGSFEMMPTTEANAFWNQTQFGAMYWKMTTPFRTARYLPGPRRFLGVLFPSPGSWWGPR